MRVSRRWDISINIIAPAINKAIVLRNELLKAYSSAGINIRKVIVDSVKLNMSLAKTKIAMEAIYKLVGSKFFGLLQKQLDAFRKRLYENMPYIIDALERLVKVVFKAFDAVTQLGLRLWSIRCRIYDFFVALDKATDGWSTVILGVVAAWKLLNLLFMATPLGFILTGLTAIVALYDDLKTYKEGGKLLFSIGDQSFQLLMPLPKRFLAYLMRWWTLATLFAISLRVMSFLNGWTCAILRLILQPILQALNEALDKIVKKFGGDTLRRILNARDQTDQWVIDKANAVGGFVSNAFKGGTPLGANSRAVSKIHNVHANMQTQINIHW